MTPFEKALIQAVNDDFSHVPPEEELDFPPISMKKTAKRNTLRRCLLAAAVCALLVGGVLAAYAVKFTLGSTEVADVTDKIHFLAEEDDRNIYYEIKFSDDFVDPAAPDEIKTFFLPTIMISGESIDKFQTSAYKSGVGRYYPFTSQPVDGDEADPEDYDLILAGPDSISYRWDPSEDVHIGLDQHVTRSVTNGTLKGYHLVYENSDLVTSSHKTIEIDEYSILTFDADFTKKRLEMDPSFSSTDIWRNWFWTDGEYLFNLSSTGLTLEEMTDLFCSIKAVSTAYPYYTEESQPDLIQESFHLMDTPAN